MGNRVAIAGKVFYNCGVLDVTTGGVNYIRASMFIKTAVLEGAFGFPIYITNYKGPFLLLGMFYIMLITISLDLMNKKLICRLQVIYL